jgi:selenocysteine-specific translation elongation factor
LKNINFVILGDNNIANELGKKGTTSDIAIYDRKTSHSIFTWALPLTFPDKVQTLMQVVNLAEYAILNVTKIDRHLGEQIIALDSVQFRDGFIVHSHDIDEADLKSITRNTSVSNFKFVDDVAQLKNEISILEPKPNEGPLMIPIDHAFDVKGVGTVVLGVMKQGSVRVHDQLKILPDGMDIIIKSIQVHDDPVNESKSPARVGLALKGIDAERISRGDVLSVPGYLKLSEGVIPVKFKKNSYYKAELAENQSYLISIGLQIKPIKVRLINEDEIEIIPENPFVYFPGQKFAILKPDSSGTRIIGRGGFIE